MDKTNGKIKVLVLADSPTCATGFAQVARNIIRTLWETGKYEFDWVGINFDGSYYDREKYPYRIYPAVNALVPSAEYHDLFGRQLFLDMLEKGDYDLVWMVQDTFIIASIGRKILSLNKKKPAEKKFKWIFYYPIDAKPKRDWIENSVLLADFPVAYTKYAYKESIEAYDRDDEEDKIRREILQKKLKVIYHGVDTEIFKPLPNKKELKEKWFGKELADKFIFMNINRNQPRKDMFRSLLACKKLLKRRKEKGRNDVYFYFHCHYADQSGLNLVEMAKQINFIAGKEWGFPNPRLFQPNKGFSVEEVNELYNAVDCVFSTTLGEGFGLSNIEAMATKTPVIFPDNTCLRELIEGKGLLVNSGKELIVVPHDNDRVRPLTDVDDLVNKMEWLLENKDSDIVKGMVEKGYKWAVGLDWKGEKVGGEWIKLFEIAYKELLKDRKAAKIEQETDFSKLKRNDICPVCSILKGEKVKFKNCIHYETARQGKILKIFWD